VLAHLQDLERVVDEHRADLLAGAAGGAGPQGLVLHAAADQRGQGGQLGLDLGDLVLVGAGARLHVLLERAAGLLQLHQQAAAVLHLVLEVVDQVHRRQRLLGGEGRAVRRAAGALGAAVVVEQALPGEVLDLADAPVLEQRLGARVVRVVAAKELRLRHRAALALLAQQDVRARAEHVDVLRVGQVVEEREHDADVHPPEHLDADMRGVRIRVQRELRAQLIEPEQRADLARHRVARDVRPGDRDLGGVHAEVAEHQQRDRAEDQHRVEAHRHEGRADEAARERVHQRKRAPPGWPSRSPP
jgi:hypothetical protein